MRGRWASGVLRPRPVGVIEARALDAAVGRDLVARVRYARLQCFGRRLAEILLPSDWELCLRAFCTWLVFSRWSKNATVPSEDLD